jgi:hypothetical protein
MWGANTASIINSAADYSVNWWAIGGFVLCLIWFIGNQVYQKSVTSGVKP